MHDVMVSDTLAFLCYWEGGLVVLSVADRTRPYLLGRFSYPRARTHSVALSPDRRTAYVTDEYLQPPFGGMHILDISDLSNIVERLWTRHVVYQGAQFGELRRRTAAAIGAVTQ
jgi:hypothetical protein